MADWRVIFDGAGEGGVNMAADEAILEAVSSNAAPPTLRLYQWERPTVSLGRFQNAARTMQAGGCAEWGIPLVRRITGGRGILHGDDLTVSVVASLDDLGLTDSSTLAIYRRIASGFVCAFRSLDVSAAMGTCARKDCGERAGESRGDCFATVSQADVIETVSGRKLLGAALFRREKTVLMQVSVPLRTAGERDRFAQLSQAVFRGTESFSEADGMPTFDVTALSAAIVVNVAETLGAAFRNAPFTDIERARTAELAASRYHSDNWTQNGVQTNAVTD